LFSSFSQLLFPFHREGEKLIELRTAQIMTAQNYCRGATTAQIIVTTSQMIVTTAQMIVTTAQMIVTTAQIIVTPAQIIATTVKISKS
jgi:hypothetical protein